MDEPLEVVGVIVIAEVGIEEIRTEIGVPIDSSAYMDTCDSLTGMGSQSISLTEPTGAFSKIDLPCVEVIDNALGEELRLRPLADLGVVE